MGHLPICSNICWSRDLFVCCVVIKQQLLLRCKVLSKIKIAYSLFFTIKWIMEVYFVDFFLFFKGSVFHIYLVDNTCKLQVSAQQKSFNWISTFGSERNVQFWCFKFEKRYTIDFRTKNIKVINNFIHNHFLLPNRDPAGNLLCKKLKKSAHFYAMSIKLTKN